jgi:16S rRNA (guanine527-N7)-methyltransferase
MPNGLMVLKGGKLEGELHEFKKYVEQTAITDFFKDEWYKEKYVIYLPL